jgi:hypothetical protein
MRKTRTRRYRTKRTINRLIAVAVICMSVLLIYFIGYPNTLSSAPAHTEEDKGRQVRIEMPNGNVLQTYESYLVEKNDHIYYKGDVTIDVTGLEMVYID